MNRTISACLENAGNLLSEAKDFVSSNSAAVALALLAQEESAKAFLLVLVRDEVLPWREEVRRSLRSHESKNLIGIVMDWLHRSSELRLEKGFSSTGEFDPACVPTEVPTAMNIYRHEMIEIEVWKSKRRGSRPEQYTDWTGSARKVAEGERDRRKQAALYVGVTREGHAVAPSVSDESRLRELEAAERLLDLASSAQRNAVFAYEEFLWFKRVFKEMFVELFPGGDEIARKREERFESTIPGVVLVRRSITIAEIPSSAEPEGGQPDLEVK